MELAVSSMSYEQRKNRQNEKYKLFLSWIVSHHYTTSSVIGKLLGLVNPRKFVRALIDKKLIRKVNCDVIKEDLYILTKAGKMRAYECSAYAEFYSLDPKRVNFSLVKHNLGLQVFLLDVLGERHSFTTDKFLDFTEKRKLPDAIVQLECGALAVEIERFQKSKSRIFQALYNHSLAIGKYRYYDKVTYVFPTESLCETYRKLLEIDGWPIYVWSKRNRKHQKSENVFNCPEKLKSRFEFVIHQGY